MKGSRKAKKCEDSPPLEIEKSLAKFSFCDDADLGTKVSLIRDISRKKVENVHEDDEIEEIEALQMYGKYGKAFQAKSSSCYGFATNKTCMLEKTTQLVVKSKTTPVKKSQPSTPSKPSTPTSKLLNKRLMEGETPSKSKRGTTPNSKLDTPLKRLQLTGDAPATPYGLRKRVAKQIEKVVEQEESSDDSCTSSEEEDMEEEEEKVVVVPSKPKRGRKAAVNEVNTDEYFESCGDALTSDKTLNNLKTPRLSPEALRSILSDEPLQYGTEIQALCQDHKSGFQDWMLLLDQGFSLILYGLGSKRNLLNDFHQDMLANKNKDVVVVNGYFESLTTKHILTAILMDIMETEIAESSHEAKVDFIGKNLEKDLYLIVHNIDGPMLRTEPCQNVLTRLASIGKIHLACSIDHINAPLLWDQKKLRQLNPIWVDATTFYPYTDETCNSENSLMVTSGNSKNSLALNSLARLFESLTPNAKGIYMLMVNYQMVAIKEEFFQGMSFKDLYRQCRRAFLVNSDLTLRAQLTEFRDHKLVRSKKGFDGVEYLILPLDSATLQEFVETQQFTT